MNREMSPTCITLIFPKNWLEGLLTTTFDNLSAIGTWLNTKREY